MELVELTTLYQLIARGGGRSRASRHAMVLGDELYVKRSTLARAGLGLFCRRRIPAGAYITAMDGIVCSGTPDPSKYHSHARTLMHATMWLAGLKTAHPPHGVGGGSYANDASVALGVASAVPSTNNAEFRVVFDPAVPTVPVVFLLARRAIPPGKEITVGYGRRY